MHSSIRSTKHGISWRTHKESVIFSLLSIYAVTTAALAVCADVATDRDPANSTEVSARLHGAILKADPSRFSKNIVFSPFSVLRALRVLAAGTSGTTLAQMRRVFDEVHTSLDLPNPSADRNGTPSTAVVRVADRLYVDPVVEDDPVFLEYRDRIREVFGVDVLIRELGKRPKATASEINAFVSEVTAARIDHIVSPLDFSPNTKLAVVNALYFKAPWRFPFAEAGSELRLFTADSLSASEEEKGREKQTVFMKNQLSENGLEFLDGNDDESMLMTALRLEYADPSFAMYIFMPSYGLRDFEEKLSQDPSTIDRLVNQMHQQRLSRVLRSASRESARTPRSVVEFWVPRFSLSAASNRLNAASVLRELGIHDLFKEGADLSRFSGNPGLHLDLFRHAADISVDERGTEAAAASYLDAADGSSETTVTRQIYIDRPFLFQIRYQPPSAGGGERGSAGNDLVLFSGHVVDASDAQREV